MNEAVIKTGGKQYKVKAGDRLKVEKLTDKEKIQFDDLLGKKKVFAKVISQGRYPKIRILKFKKRKRYKRARGHHQLFTEIEILKIQ